MICRPACMKVKFVKVLQMPQFHEASQLLEQIFIQAPCLWAYYGLLGDFKLQWLFLQSPVWWCLERVTTLHVSLHVMWLQHHISTIGPTRLFSVVDCENTCLLSIGNNLFVTEIIDVLQLSHSLYESLVQKVYRSMQVCTNKDNADDEGVQLILVKCLCSTCSGDSCKAPNSRCKQCGHKQEWQAHRTSSPVSSISLFWLSKYRLSWEQWVMN